MANIGFISLGCAKNQVDCERMMYRVQEAGHTVKGDIVGSDVVVINTCGFIDSAKSEAIDFILQTAALKAEGLVGKILVTGCLSQRYQTMILDYFDREVDSGTKIYVQYETVNSYYPTDYRSWVQDDRLFCQLYGDLQCMNGGIEAFLEEEDHAYLICHDIGMDWDLLIDYPIVSEDGPLMMLENFN